MRLAVLELTGSLGDDILNEFTDAVRGGAVEGLRGGSIQVVDRDNMMAVIHEMGRPECSEGDCAVETARYLRAQFVLSGEVKLMEDTFVVTLKLHSTQAAGPLLGSEPLEAKSQLEFRQKLRDAGRHLTSVYLTDSRGAVTPARDQEKSIRAQQNFDVNAEEKVVVSFDSEPAGAAVIVDGNMLCKETPCSKAMIPGQHDVEIQKEHYDRARTSFVARKDAVVKLPLVANFATLTVTTQPAGLPVAINGKREIYSGGSATVDPGQYQVTVDDRCYLPEGEQVVVKRGELRAITLVARPRLAAIAVSAEDTGGNDVEAQVTVDGIAVGTAPGTFKIPVCSREVQVAANNGAYREYLQLVEKQTTTIKAHLQGGYLYSSRSTLDDEQSATATEPRPDQGAHDRGWQAGLRLAYAIAIGKATGANNGALDNLAAGEFPIILDVGYRIIPALYLGGYVGGSPGFRGSNACSTSAAISNATPSTTTTDCWVYDFRVGVDFRYIAELGKAHTLWFGTGTGYDMLTVTAKNDKSGQNYGGWEYLHLESGFDFGGRATQAIFGAFASLTMAQYSRVQQEDTGGNTTELSISNTATHYWLLFGIRGALNW